MSNIKRKKIRKILKKATKSKIRLPKNEPKAINQIESDIKLTAFIESPIVNNEIDLKEILNQLMEIFTINNENPLEREIIIDKLSSKIIETIKIIEEALKQECNNKNKNSLLNLLQNGYGKYIGTIKKIFEIHKHILDETFTKFEKQFSEIYNKIKSLIVYRYLSVDEKLLAQHKVDPKHDNKNRKNSDFPKNNPYSMSEEDFLKDFFENNNKEEIKKEKFLKNINLKDSNLEFKHFRKKFCVKIAKILQIQYGYEKQKSHELTIRIEKKLRKEFPKTNSDYKTNGIFLLNLLKVLFLTK